MTFTLKIKLGNDAMQTAAEVRGALLKVLAGLDRLDTLARRDGGAIFDLNGNRVGSWEVK